MYRRRGGPDAGLERGPGRAAASLPLFTAGQGWFAGGRVVAVFAERYRGWCLGAEQFSLMVGRPGGRGAPAGGFGARLARGRLAGGSGVVFGEPASCRLTFG